MTLVYSSIAKTMILQHKKNFYVNCNMLQLATIFARFCIQQGGGGGGGGKEGGGGLNYFAQTLVVDYFDLLIIIKTFAIIRSFY